MELTDFLFLYLVDIDYLYDCIMDGCYDEDSKYGHIFEGINFDSDTIYDDLEEAVSKWAQNNKIEIQSTELTGCDLDSGTEDYRMVFSMNGHYYAFEYCYNNYGGYESDEIGNELKEVFPVEKTIIVYE